MNNPALSLHNIGWRLANSNAIELTSLFIDECMTPEAMQNPQYGQTRYFVHGLMSCMVYQRDHFDLTIQLSDVREAAALDNMIALANDHLIPLKARSFLHQYVSYLPAYTHDAAMAGTLPPQTETRHHELTGTFISVLDGLIEQTRRFEDISHSLYGSGNADQLRALIIDHLPDDTGRAELRLRTSEFVSALMKSLTYLRDRGDISLDVTQIRSYLPLPRVCDLALGGDLPDIGVTALKQYLSGLPGYNEDDARAGHLHDTTTDQHNSITGLLAEII